MGERASDPLGGVKCFSIAGRMANQRLRCAGMTEEERRWRAQFLKDQILTPEEPVNVPEYYKATHNIFRRLYLTPLSHLENILQSFLGEKLGYTVRHAITKSSVIFAFAVFGFYYVKHCGNTFIYDRMLNTTFSLPVMYADDPDFPNYKKMSKEEYADLGFYSSPLYEKYERPPPPPPPSPKPRRADGSEIICPPPGKD